MFSKSIVFCLVILGLSHLSLADENPFLGLQCDFPMYTEGGVTDSQIRSDENIRNTVGKFSGNKTWNSTDFTRSIRISLADSWNSRYEMNMMRTLESYEGPTGPNTKLTCTFFTKQERAGLLPFYCVSHGTGSLENKYSFSMNFREDNNNRLVFTYTKLPSTTSKLEFNVNGLVVTNTNDPVATSTVEFDIDHCQPLKE